LSAGIYRITNKVTGEIYVGYSTNLEKRYLCYKRNRVQTQPLIYNSIKAYGFHNHDFHVLFSFEVIPTTFQLKQLEGAYIRYYKYWKGCNMLNTNEGGGGSRKQTEQQKKQRSLNRIGIRKKVVLQYDLNGKFLKKWDSISAISNTLDLDYNYLIRCLKSASSSNSIGGFQWRYSETDDSAKKIGQYDLAGNLIRTWRSAGEFLNTNNKSKGAATAILNVCKTAIVKKGKYSFRCHKAYGYNWKFIESDLSSKGYCDIEPYDNATCKKILQYTLNGSFIQEWDSIIDASNNLGITTSEISKLLNDRANEKFRKITPKYQWQYKENDSYPSKITPLLNPVIVQYDKDGNFVKEWSILLKEIATELGIPKCIVTKKGQTCGGFQWRRYIKETYPLTIEKHKEFKKNAIEAKESILQYDLFGKFIKAWKYLALIEDELKINSGSIILCAKGKLKSAGGFQWRKGVVKDEMEDIQHVWIICQYDKSGELIREWKGIKEIHEVLGYRKSQISACISGLVSEVYDCTWRYK
jgi:group I intron endonuclease